MIPLNHPNYNKTKCLRSTTLILLNEISFRASKLYFEKNTVLQSGDLQDKLEIKNCSFSEFHGKYHFCQILQKMDTVRFLIKIRHELFSMTNLDRTIVPSPGTKEFINAAQSISSRTYYVSNGTNAKLRKSISVKTFP